MGCNCKKKTVVSQPKQVTKTVNKSISPRTQQRTTTTKRIIRRRPL